MSDSSTLKPVPIGTARAAAELVEFARIIGSAEALKLRLARALLEDLQ